MSRINNDMYNDMYVREDGYLLHDAEATNERKRAIARMKARDLHNLRQRAKPETNPSDPDSSSSGDESDSKPPNSPTESPSKLSAKIFRANARASCSKASTSFLNAQATGARASATASANGIVCSAGNAQITGTEASASATANGLVCSVGNAHATGAEASLSASATAATVQMGNLDMNGGSIGASAKVNGVGVKCFNATIGGPSAAASVTVDGSLSFGNVNLGLRPSLDIGFGLNIGIPFLSGSRLGSDCNSGNGDQNTTGQTGNDGQGLERAQNYLSSKFPNKRYYVKETEVYIRENNSSEEIDPVLNDSRNRQNDGTTESANIVAEHVAVVAEGNKFVGFRGCPPPNAAKPNSGDNKNSETPVANTNPSSNDEWKGMYTSPNPGTAGGYVFNDQGKMGVIKRAYIPADASKTYYTKTPLDTKEGLMALKEVKKASSDTYVFTGPQSSSNPDLFSPETVISPSVRDNAHGKGPLILIDSAHKPTQRGDVERLHRDELACSKIVPDYIVDVKTGQDCSFPGGRENLAHVFDRRTWSIPPEDPPSKPEPSEDDKLLLEECKKLGDDDLTLSELNYWKNKLKSDQEYEDEIDLISSSNTNTNTNRPDNNTEKKDDEQTNTGPPEPCRDHGKNVRCMKCISGSSTARTQRVTGNVHGFKFNN